MTSGRAPQAGLGGACVRQNLRISIWFFCSA